MRSACWPEPRTSCRRSLDELLRPSPAREAAPVSCWTLAFGRAHQIGESGEEIMAVARAGRGLRMILHREHRPVFQGDAAVRSVKQRDMRLLRALRQRLAVDREAVIHRSNLDLAGGEILHRMIGAVMALMHFHRAGADREPQHLMTETDAESRRA